MRTTPVFDSAHNRQGYWLSGVGQEPWLCTCYKESNLGHHDYKNLFMTEHITQYLDVYTSNKMSAKTLYNIRIHYYRIAMHKELNAPKNISNGLHFSQDMLFTHPCSCSAQHMLGKMLYKWWMMKQCVFVFFNTLARLHTN